MPGSAPRGSNLVDDLLPDIDGLRGDLHADFGVRPFRVYTVRRAWSGTMVGEGTATDTVAEITPAPRVLTWDGYEFDLTHGGIVSKGELKLTEVSLTYTHTEITGGTLAQNVQWFIRIDEGHGQGQPSRYYVHAKPPFPDREKDIGWVIWLRAAQVPGCP